MRTIIPLGCNCHPAWWLRKLGFRRQALPFDWLLSKPHLGLGYALEVWRNGFAGWLDDLGVNARGHPVAPRYPQVELFHHHDLVAADAGIRDAERTRLEQRARDFVTIVEAEEVQFLYCYALLGRLPKPEELRLFETAIDGVLQASPVSTLHVYFLTDLPEMRPTNVLAARPRLVEHVYFRDQSVDKNWGTQPEFLRDLALPRDAFGTEERR